MISIERYNTEISISDELDANGDIEIEVERNGIYAISLYTNKEEGQKIIAHLQQVFEIEPAKTSKWTSVNDGMPEEEGLYITYWSDGVTESFPLIKNHLGELEFGTACSTTVTHWAPLLDAPA